MKKTTSSEIKRGQAITFRVPSDTSDYTLVQLQRLKETEKRNFSSKIAQFVLNGVGSDVPQDKEILTLPLPQRLSKAQRDWLKHAHSEALLGSIMYELLINPMRATALFASLKEETIEIPNPMVYEIEPELALPEIAMDVEEFSDLEEDVEQAKLQPVEPEGQLDELLGDFLAQMNK
jgi:hypothetical protein